MKPNDVAVLIPSLQPDDRLPGYVSELLNAGIGAAVIVDDGSGKDYAPIFDKAAEMGATILTHEKNRGKGAALRTGLDYLTTQRYLGVVTADADGQHTVKDILRLAERLKENGDELLLGSRDLTGKNVPPKSRMGNRCTTLVFAALYGRWLPDTQTGLRAADKGMFDFLRNISGDRYEYEMNMLIQCSLRHIKMEIIPIETIYHNDNKGSHFHPLKDSWRIYKLIFGNFIRFISSSLLSTGIDLGVFFVMDRWLVELLLPQAVVVAGLDARVALSAFVARAISSVINFKLNETMVFRIRKSKGAFFRYALLALCALAVSSALVSGINIITGLDKTFIKAIVDTCLFFVNYRVQRAWVFRSGDEKGEKA